MSSDKDRPLPKFGEWDVNDPASAEGYTVIFNKARDEKKTGGKPDSPGKVDSHTRPPLDHGKTQSKSWFCCVQSPPAES
ncbi:protein NOI4-like isoform X2 [Lotus japonicus]|uniref:protein NOI4-like isoform X2 n=1 Tax=Lotus japonicus TaxID=34305 RepID=UPI00258F61D5|nr:protein NOI4-like isoform X2 [Lotus japonicus]